MSEGITNQPLPRISEPALIAVTWALCGAATCLIVARLVTRWHFSRRWFIDDYLAVFALMILIGNSIVLHVMAGPMYEILAVSTGRLEPDAGFMDRATLYLKCQFASTVLFWSCLWAVKACFLAFFYRLTNQLKWPRRMWWTIVVITTLSYIGSCITYPVSCTSFVLGECQTPLNIERSLVSLRYSTAVDIITDVMTFICLPIYLTLNLKMTLAQKLSLIGVLGLGVIITIFSVVRIIQTNASGRQPEISWLALWSSIESSIAVIVACLASFKVLLTSRKRGTRTPYAGLSGERSSAKRYLGNSGKSSQPSRQETGDKFAYNSRAGTRISAHRVNPAEETEMQVMGPHRAKNGRDITVTRTVTVSDADEGGLKFGFNNSNRGSWPQGGKGQNRRRKDRDDDNESEEQILR